MRWGRAVWALGLVLVLSSCGAESNPLFIEGDGAARSIGWRECPGAKDDGILEVGLYKWDDSSTVEEPGEMLWHIKAERRERGEQIVPLRWIRLGSEPQGFVTQLPLAAALDSESTYALRANMISDELVSGFLTFRPEQLATGRVVFGEGEAESRKAYDDRDSEQFGCFSG